MHGRHNPQCSATMILSLTSSESQVHVTITASKSLTMYNLTSYNCNSTETLVFTELAWFLDHRVKTPHYDN